MLGSKVGMIVRIGVGIMAFSAVALAASFSRDLSGVWSAPSIGRVVIVHTPDTGRAVFTLKASSPKLPEDFVLSCKGSVTRGREATTFVFGSSEGCDPFSYRRDDMICEVTPAFGVTGTLVGQVGSREIVADGCSYTLSVVCRRNGEHVTGDFIQKSCVGTWN